MKDELSLKSFLCKVISSDDSVGKSEDIEELPKSGIIPGRTASPNDM